MTLHEELVLESEAAPEHPPVKVGLALAGGGFRASLFHLGVFRRLAELDLLRRVEVISTVSGGSIIGALFVLLLRKKRLEVADRPLDRCDYLVIVEEVEDALLAGIQKNLRNRLFANPIALLWTVVTPFSLGNRMARLYERYLYGNVVRTLRRERNLADGRNAWQRLTRPGAFPLDQIRPVPRAHTDEGAVRQLPGGREAYNQQQRLRADGCAVPHLVLNATSMNSGARFSMSSSEVGDWTLGYARPSEVANFMRLKAVIDALDGGMSADDARALLVEKMTEDAKEAERNEEARAERTTLAQRRAEQARARSDAEADMEEYARLVIPLAQWVASLKEADRARREGRPPPPSSAVEYGPWSSLLSDPGGVRHIDLLVTIPFGLLREAQVPAWFARREPTRTEKTSGGWTIEQLHRQFRQALADIHSSLADAIPKEHGEPGDQQTGRLMDLVIHVFALRCAAAVSPHLGRDLKALTVGDAVGASACFPPVFSPFMIQGLYDDAHVRTLGLTDGGVFDNAGLTALRDEHCTCIIASDTGGAFDVHPHASASHLNMLVRIGEIMQADQGRSKRISLMEQRRLNRELERIESEDWRPPEDDAHPGPVAGAIPPPQEVAAMQGARAEAIREADAMRDEIRSAREKRLLRGLAFFHIETPTPTIHPPALPSPVSRHLLARMRTDLDGFGEVEIAALVNRGYALADGFVRQYLGAFEAAWSPAKPWADVPPAFPHPSPESAEEVARATKIVQVGGERFFRSLRLLPAPPSVVSLLVLIGLAAAAGLRAGDAATWAGPHLATAAAWLRDLPEWDGWRGRPLWVWEVAIGLAIGLPMAWSRFVSPLLSAGQRRFLGTMRKYAVWLLPLGILFVLPEARPWVALGLGLIVFGLPLYAFINHVFFYLPFRRATRIR